MSRQLGLARLATQGSGATLLSLSVVVPFTRLHTKDMQEEISDYLLANHECGTALVRGSTYSRREGLVELVIQKLQSLHDVRPGSKIKQKIPMLLARTC